MQGRLWCAVICAIVLCAGCARMPSNAGIVGVLGPGVEVELVREGFVFTEGPVGTADGSLLFTDLRASRIYRLDPTGAFSLFRDQTNETNGLALTRTGELLAAETGGKRISVSSVSSGGAPPRELTRGDGARELVAINDLIADDKGGIYFTDPAMRPIVPGRKVYVYYLPPGASAARIVDDGIVRPNGLTLTIDGKTLLVDDTVGHTVFAFDVQPDGSLTKRRPFIRLRGIPEGDDSGADGMAIDREGRIYVTSAVGVQVFDRRGEYLGTIPIPRRPTNVAFAGQGKRILYVTAREGLYRAQTLTRGPDRLGK